MSKKLLVFVIFFLAAALSTSKPVHAAENPLAVANNKMGIHILSPDELSQAAELINSNGGDWGYVIIPMQTGDRDTIKWQNFMNDCKRLRVIPIIRLATQAQSTNTADWRKPEPSDIIDFANFLGYLDWPTKNRYIIVFNEVNRGDEWGGVTNPSEYAELLSFAISVFKSKSTDFFMISAGMDNAAPEQGSKYMNEYNYLKRMNQAVPGIFNQVDGISSHSYPNPGFVQPPDTKSPMGTGSFAYERSLIKSFTPKTLPVFITETGWTSDKVSDQQRAQYYTQAFQTVWNDPGIVTVMPFLLQAGAGPFEKFSFLSPTGDKTQQYQALKSMPKVKGVPSFPTTRVLAAHSSRFDEVKSNPAHENPQPDFSFTKVLKDIFNYIILR